MVMDRYNVCDVRLFNYVRTLSVMFESYSKSGSLNPFPVTDLLSQVELVHCTYCACAGIIVRKAAEKV